MNTSNRQYLRAGEPANMIADLKDGLAHYTGAFLEVINQAHPADTPIIVASLTHCLEIMKDSEFYQMAPNAPKLVNLILTLFRPDVEVVRTCIPRALMEKFRAMEQADAEAEEAEE